MPKDKGYPFGNKDDKKTDKKEKKVLFKEGEKKTKDGGKKSPFDKFV